MPCCIYQSEMLSTTESLELDASPTLTRPVHVGLCVDMYTSLLDHQGETTRERILWSVLSRSQQPATSPPPGTQPASRLKNVLFQEPAGRHGTEPGSPYWEDWLKWIFSRVCVCVCVCGGGGFTLGKQKCHPQHIISAVVSPINVPHQTSQV